MSLKLIEMQVALPRTLDASKTAELIQQRGQVINEEASAQLEKTSVEKRSQISKSENAEKNSNDNKQEKPKHPHSSGKDRRKDNKGYQHPYKGNNFDYSQ
ncbi:hypothetical protein [Falsibacillus albus]|uniref:RNA polymerase subunit sigma n=1 Tax=Falsibacillus albus TaxID=2478915 RepID=A0A3L7JZY8_9BACI|nr:hypothetical protein [Falsibacillus albus]RLQ95719.1 hypothetical protein D9X91_08825 [Falsibacillus albus]